MDKASSPRNRLTRSAAKQVTTPKRVESTEDVKLSNRKPRKKAATKPKTNGETTSNDDENSIKQLEEVSDSNSFDGIDSDDSNLSLKKLSKSVTKNTSSNKAQRKSNRITRSITPGPDLDTSVSKRMKRSTSESKLESISTPTKRGTRAKSESKDFIFTPKKCEDAEKLSPLTKSSSKYIHRNSVLRVISESAEASEIDETSQNERIEEDSNCNKLSNTNKSLDTEITNCTDNNKVVSEKIQKNVSEEIVDVDSDKEEKDIQLNDHSSLVKEDSTVTLSTTIDNSDLAENSNNERFKNDYDFNNIKKTDSLVNTQFDNENRDPVNDPQVLNTNLENEPHLTLPSDMDVDVDDSKEKHGNECQIESKNIRENVTVSTQSSNLKMSEKENTDSNLSDLKETDHLISSEVNHSVCILNQDKKDEIPSNTLDDDKVNNKLSGQVENIVVKHSDHDNDTMDKESHMIVVEEECCEPDVIECTDDKNKSDIVSLDIDGNSNDAMIELEDNDEEKYCNRVTDQVNVCITSNTGIDEDKVNNKLSCQMENITIVEESEQNIIDKESDNVVLEEVHCESDIELTDDKNKSDIAVVDDNLNNATIVLEDCKEESNLVTLEDCNTVSNNPIDDQFIAEHPIDNQENNEIIPLESQVSQSYISECNKNDNLQIADQCAIVDINDSFVLRMDSELDNVDTFTPGDNDESKHVVLDDDQSPSINVHTETADINEVDYSDANDKPQRMDGLHSKDTEETDDTDSSVKNDESDCDIYKDMSDICSDVEDRTGKSRSDDHRSSGSGESESYTSSLDGEGSSHKDDSDPLSGASKPAENLKNMEEDSKKNNDKSSDTNNPKSPMTYEKALALINENRVKKIDDEEFFDMFTQELNRVSAESGSDSDVAIVDEYIMEPEEPKESKKSAIKVSQSSSNVAQKPQSPACGPVKISEHFSKVYNQQHISPQQINPVLSKTNFSQGAMYQHYGQHMMSPTNSIRGPVLFDQYTQGPMAMTTPQIFNPRIPPNMHFNRPGSFSHALGPPSNSHVYYPNLPPLRVKNVNTLNRSALNPIHRSTEHLSALETNSADNGCDYTVNLNRNATISTSTMTDKEGKQDQATSYSLPATTNIQSMETVLEALGLNEEKLELLKIALGIEKMESLANKHRKTTLNKVIGKTNNATTIRKPRIRSKEKTKVRKRSLYSKKVLENEYACQEKTEDSTTDHSTDDASYNVGGSTETNKNEQGESSCEEISDNENRQINLDGDNVSVTFKTSPFNDSPNKHFAEEDDEFDTLSESSQNWHTLLKKRKRVDRTERDSSDKTPSSKKRKRLNATKTHSTQSHVQNSPNTKSKAMGFNWDCSKNTGVEISMKRKISGKAKNKKTQHKVLKSNCGIFTIEAMAATSQSSDSSESDVNSCSDQEAGPSNYVQEKSQKRRKDVELNKGKNKLSSLFSEHSLKKVKASGKIEKQQRKKRARTLKKLPREVLERLVDEEHADDDNQELDSGSDDKPRKKRKRASKIKLNSKIADRGYIPCITSGPTQFGLSRLDDDTVLSAAQIAAKFRTDRLYGPTVKRVTILDFKR